MKVIFLPATLEYLENLVTILYTKEYFSYLETSKKYVDELIDDILTGLPNRLHKPAPRHFDRYGKGMKYAGFRKNKQTTWYVFFKTYRADGETVYVVRYIANNHVVAQYL